MDKKYLLEQVEYIGERFYNEKDLVEIYDFILLSDEGKLAAALLLCTCDSNERKAGE